MLEPTPALRRLRWPQPRLHARQAFLRRLFCAALFPVYLQALPWL
ncbi:hypothetical protein Asbog_00881 [Asaia bogorensis NBRC 16594]|nr:hypothetical protein Asbog_00881 [Asaia bogorensis NBRC 16594]